MNVPEVADTELMATRLEVLRERIRSAGADPEAIRIVAVTKTFPAAAVEHAYAVGLRHFGENYADELVRKAAALELPDLAWHFIGSIQRNKLARLAPVAAVYEGVTRVEEGRDLARRRPGAHVLVEVDASGVAGRPGVQIAAVPALVAALRELELSVDGLMTVAAPGGGARASAAFSAVGALAAALGLRECSMGMSEDLELAVAAGSTEIRVGTALFGPRTLLG